MELVNKSTFYAKWLQQKRATEQYHSSYKSVSKQSNSADKKQLD